MKKILLLKLLALVACMSSALSATAYNFSAVCNGVLMYFNITSSTNKTVEVTYKEDGYYNYHGTYAYEGAVTIPSTVYYNGSYYTVTAIGRYAFCQAGRLTSITIPNTVTSIGDYAFSAFESDSEPNRLTSVTIPNSVITIGEGAFSRSYSLQTVVIGDGVTSIGEDAFSSCYNITNMTVGSSVTSIGDYAFSFDYRWSDYQEYGEDCIRPVTFHMKSINPPTIQKHTFSGKSDPAAEDWHYNPYIRHTVYVEGPYAQNLYKNATYWSNFYTYSHLVTNHRYDFYTGGIYYLISGTNTVKVTNKYGGRVPGIASTNDYSYTGSVTIPTTAYYSGTSKTYNVTAIGYGAFNEDRQMNKNSTGEAPSLRDQGDLKSVTMGSSIQTIEDYAFYKCTGLTNVTIGSGVTSIGSYAFNGCTALTTVTCQRSTPATIQSTTFDNSHYSTVTLKVPSTSAVNSYKAATYWKNFYLIVPNGGELNYALNVSGGNINFTSTGTYPWIVKSDGTRIYAQSSNGGVTSSTSTMSASVSLSKPHTVTFDFKAWGEGTSYDVCIFSIDGVEQFKYGARQNDWESYSAAIPAGSHTLTWSYQKDGSVNPTGDYFAVDNVKLTEVTIQPGDVNGDGNVNISDVTTLIDILLAGTTPPAGSDVDGNGSVNISDVTALIDLLLNGI